MVQKRKKTKKKTKKQQQQQEHLQSIFLGVFFIFLGFFGLLKLGFLGILTANILRVICGNLFFIAAILLMVYGVILVIFSKDFPVKNKRPIVGATLFFLGILLFLHAYMFRNMSADSTAIIENTWNLLKMDIKNNRIMANVGGGMVGALLLLYFRMIEIPSLQLTMRKYYLRITRNIPFISQERYQEKALVGDRSNIG